MGVLLRAYQPLVKSLLQSGWAVDQLQTVFGWLNYVLLALFYGFLFGLPLGRSPKRFIVVTWVIFGAAFLATIAVRRFLDLVDILSVVKTVTHAFYLLTLAATLLFAFVTNRVLSAYTIHRAAA
jgi:hypothetical protein